MNIPTYLNNLLINYYGNDITDEIINGFNQERITSLRVNTLKTTKEEVIDVLKANNIEYKNVDNMDFALIINADESVIRELNIYKEGKVYLQSLSSMLPPLYLDLKEGSTILDMASSPGGKTSEICALMNNKIFVTATEVNSIRFDRLKHNLELLGCKNITCLKKDARDLDDYFVFDNILLDSPCSGSGTIENGDYSKISEELINKIQKTQYELLKKALTMLKKGNTLVYSTCSILKCENEDIIEKVKKEFNIEIVPIEANIKTLPSTIDGVITVMPTKEYEGFFVAKIKKV